MSNTEIIRAWKDPAYRSTLSVVPKHPAGVIALTDPAFRDTAGEARGFRNEIERYADPTHPVSHTLVCHFTKAKCF